jgi:DNA polymerase III delta subunit
MLYLIYGTDVETARAKAHGLFDALKAKKPDASAGTLNAEQVTLGRLDELTQTQGLFENRQIIFMDRTLEGKEARELVLERIDELGDSPNIFIFFEGKLSKEVLKKLEKRAEKVQEYVADDAPREKKDGGFFALADALGSRDKKTLWVMFREAMDRGAAPEEIHGILFWQAKSLALAGRTRDAGETGLNPFVYGKAKRYAGNFKPGETDALLSRLVHMYHGAHRGEGDFEVALEKMILDL